MKIYKFELVGYTQLQLELTEYEAEEKPKTYTAVRAGSSWSQRINKSDIGVVSGYSNNQVFLLENDSKKAAEILLREQNRQLQTENNRHEREVGNINSLIHLLEETLNE